MPAHTQQRGAAVDDRDAASKVCAYRFHAIRVPLLIEPAILKVNVCRTNQVVLAEAIPVPQFHLHHG